MFSLTSNDSLSFILCLSHKQFFVVITHPVSFHTSMLCTCIPLSSMLSSLCPNGKLYSSIKTQIKCHRLYEAFIQSPPTYRCNPHVLILRPLSQQTLIIHQPVNLFNYSKDSSEKGLKSAHIIVWKQSSFFLIVLIYS